MGEEAVAYLDDFAKAIHAPSPIVRSKAIGAIAACGETGQMYAAEICRKLADDDSRVRVAVAAALSLMGERGAAFADEIAPMLEDVDPEAREATVNALGAFGLAAVGDYYAAIDALAFYDDDDRVKAAAKKVTA